jgi:cytochrome c biogenesis protein CcdA
MDLGAWVQAILEDGDAPLAAAFLIGLLASLGPCPLATNVTALGYISKEISSLRRVLLTCGLYTLGRTLAYGGLGVVVLAAGFQISRVSNSLQTLAEIALGPLLILAGLVLLDVIRPTLNIGGVWMERLSAQVADWHYLGAFLLGALFALAFKLAGGVALPFLFGVGTSVPVIVVGVPLALGVMRFAAGLNTLRVARRQART